MPTPEEALIMIGKALFIDKYSFVITHLVPEEYLRYPNPFENYILAMMYKRPDDWHEFSEIYQSLEDYTDLFDRRNVVMAKERLFISEFFLSMLFGGRAEPRICLSKKGVETWEERLGICGYDIGKKVENAEALELLREDIMKRNPESGTYRTLWLSVTEALQRERLQFLFRNI